MEITETKVQPTPPNIIRAIRSGFDVVANRIYVILIPVILDAWLWLGPHLQIKEIINAFLESIRTTGGLDPANSGSMLFTDAGVLQAALERINLMSLIRSYPVGVPSLLSGMLSVDAPTRSIFFIDINLPIVVLLLWVVLSLIGILAGTFYYLIIAQAVFDQRISLKKALLEWPFRIPQILLISLMAVLILLVLMIPSMCILSVVTAGGIPVSQIAIIILAGMLMWVLFPLAFTPLGIFTYRINLINAVQRSIVVTRMTLPGTILFFLVVFSLGQGLDILWRVPGENSWFELVGLAGHAFVSSALLAATFVYYRDADVWVHNILRKTQLSRAN
jgi:hypothetical protein